MARERGIKYFELLLMVFLGLAVRVLAGRNSIMEGSVLINGYDDYYHMRRILYTITHFPNVLWFDSYLNYPKGFESTWPPLFDQLAATVSLALGLQSRNNIEMITASFFPLIIGSAAIIIVYYLVKELFDEERAILCALLAAIAPFFISKTMIGSTDHHGLEVLLALASFYFLVLALNGNKEKNFFPIASGIMMAGLAYTWFGAALYFGIILVYAVVELTLDLKHGSSFKGPIRSILMTYGVLLALMLPFWNAVWMRPSFYALTVYIIILIILYTISAHFADIRNRWMIFSILSLGLMLVVILIQFLSYDTMLQITKLVRYSQYIFEGQMGGKISEAQPLLFTSEMLFSNKLFSNLGWSLLFSIAGLFAVLNYYRHSEESKKRGLLLFFILSSSLLILTFAQIRFIYFFNIIMSILIGNLFYQIIAFIEQKRHMDGLAKYIISFAILLVLVMPFASDVFALSNENPPIAGDWYETLNWISANTKNTSFYNNPSKIPEYSVMSWWDYGNWIVYQGKRPVVANNFLAGIPDAVRFFLSDNEEIAAAVMDARSSRYVITDYDMLYNKMAAIATWANEDPSDYMRVKEFGSYIVAEPTDKLMNTTMAQLHFRDATGMGHFRLIYESANLVGKNHPHSKVKLFEYVPGAVIKIISNPNKKFGVFLNITSNQGRTFQYFNVGKPIENGSEIRVPYSTEHRSATHAQGPYSLLMRNSGDLKIQKLEVSEEDVLEGRTIEVSF